jgi:2-iminoacetate synthase
VKSLAVARRVGEESFIPLEEIGALLGRPGAPTKEEVQEVVSKARELKGLDAAEVSVLLRTEDPELVSEMFAAARQIKDDIYGKRVVLFAPLYYSNHCVNNCLYCAFRTDNPMPRRRLTLEEVARETAMLEDQGHKRLLVIGGEEPGTQAVDNLIEVIETVYAVRSGKGEIRRVNVEAAPMRVEEFTRLKQAKIGTFVMFQETYDPEVYRRMHPSGPKANYLWRLFAMDRAMEGGVDDVGIGALLGLSDYRFEVLAMMFHARHLEEHFGAGPHTISVPRIEAAEGAPAAVKPPVPLSDVQFKKVVAVLRMAVPYTGIILSTRERASLRTDLLDLGVSQMSAGSQTSPGGYTDPSEVAQFSVGDHRSLDEVIADIAKHGYIPSFCTGCYRKGRTGQDFMDLAKPGLIRMHCLPNALFTFQEYLEDYASAATREIGERAISDQVEHDVPEGRRADVGRVLSRIRNGDRDLYF